MIDWKRRGLALAVVVNRNRKDRMHSDYLLGWEMAKELVALAKIEEKANKKFLQWYRCSNKVKAEKLFEEYLKLVRKIR